MPETLRLSLWFFPASSVSRITFKSVAQRELICVEGVTFRGEVLVPACGCPVRPAWGACGDHPLLGPRQAGAPPSRCCGFTGDWAACFLPRLHLPVRGRAGEVWPRGLRDETALTFRLPCTVVFLAWGRGVQEDCRVPLPDTKFDLHGIQRGASGLHFQA